MKLETDRKQIDEVDREIVNLLNRRAQLSRKIGETKSRAGLPIVDRGREEAVLRSVVRDSAGEMDSRVLTRIYREILTESRRIQTTVMIQTAGEICK